MNFLPNPKPVKFLPLFFTLLARRTAYILIVFTTAVAVLWVMNSGDVSAFFPTYVGP